MMMTMRLVNTTLVLAALFGSQIAFAGTRSPEARPGSDGSVPVPPGPLSLQICFELAVLRSETLGMSEEDIRVAQARYWQAIGSILPRVHAIASETLQNSTGGGGGSGVLTGDSFDSSGFGGSRKDRFISRLNVTQPIFSGFREFSTASATQATIEAHKQSKERTRQLLYLDVADVFYQILLYQGDMDLLDEMREALDDRVKELDRRVQLGRSRTGESLMAKSALAESLVSIEQARGLLGASTELLCFLTGVRSAKLELRDEQILPDAEALESYLASTGERPDILAAIQSERAARKELSAAKGEHWPTISAEGNYYLNESPSSRREWNIFLTFDLPIFEGGVIEARVNERQALARSSELNLERLRRAADTEVRTAYNNFVTSAAQGARLQEAVQVGEANYQVQMTDHKLGLASNLDVLDALGQWHDMRRRLLMVQTDARVNLVRLHVAAGDLRE